MQILTRLLSGRSGLVTAPALLAGLLLWAGGTLAGQAGVSLENSLGMRFVRIPAGEFIMGTTDIEAARMEFPALKPDDALDEAPSHRVRITQPFYLGRTTVTQGDWYRVMENRPGPAAFWQGDGWQQRPMATASWFMAARFVEELNKLDSDYHYRLPTEAEWEYAARAGSQDLRPMPVDDLEDYAWFINNSGDFPQAVATRKPNAFGLYDMLGNVWEWVADWYAADSYANAQRDDPVGPAEGTSKVRRGGSYHCPTHLLRPGYRGGGKPGIAYEVNGFRVIAEAR